MAPVSEEPCGQPRREHDLEGRFSWLVIILGLFVSWLLLIPGSAMAMARVARIVRVLWPRAMRLLQIDRTTSAFSAAGLEDLPSLCYLLKGGDLARVGGSFTSGCGVVRSRDVAPDRPS